MQAQLEHLMIKEDKGTYILVDRPAAAPAPFVVMVRLWCISDA